MSPKEVNTDPCNVCGVIIRYKSDIPRHAQLHRSTDSVTMYKCPFLGCDYQNLQKSNLNTHIRTHTGEKPHACPNCDYRTADPGSLTRHRKTQHGYVPEYQRPKAKPPSASTSKQAARHNPYKPRERLPNIISSTHYSRGPPSPPTLSPAYENFHTPYPQSHHYHHHHHHRPATYTWDKNFAIPESVSRANMASASSSAPFTLRPFHYPSTSTSTSSSSHPDPSQYQRTFDPATDR